MAISFALVERTVYRLRYLATITAVSPAAIQTATIPNDGGASPDLLTDITAAWQVADGKSSGQRQGLREIIRARLDGFGPIAAGALSQAQARALLNSDDPGAAILKNEVLGRAQLSIMQRTCDADAGGAQMAVDANIDGQGDPVVEVQVFMTGSLNISLTAIIGVEYAYSVHR